MKKVLKLTLIGIIGGVVLALILWIVLALTGNTAYYLLFNFDYIPWINNLRPIWLWGNIFHYLTCIISVIALFYILNIKGWHKLISPYVAVYTIGGGGLFFLTALSHLPPAANDVMAWIYWTLAHAIFGLVVGLGVKSWIKE
ncbi:hypothetical protein EI546_09925 [Aequorivita sp. H23M31]|uniref:Uncharacterized protein n=1 Tax=Aequorivita ciconiae TaxID=2494375 RepID=A0A410G453_9FLAO|nr:hypothetical protein [Aequorivita sp. H23M31]QAA82021.1 hypothetical protein EI546_09925 [Aequorivita sp. H23M31]